MASSARSSTGAFKVGTLKANGSAIVEINGATTTLFVDADLADAGFAARIEGAVIITDGIAETVQLDAAVTGSLNFGDATLTGATLSVRSSYGSPLGPEVHRRAPGRLPRQHQRRRRRPASARTERCSASRATFTGSLNARLLGPGQLQRSVVASPDQVTLSGHWRDCP